MGEFIGIWVSKELIELRLSPSKTMVLSMIISLQPCRASNGYMAEKLNITRRSVERSVKELQEMKLIKASGNTSSRVITTDKIPEAVLASYRQNVGSTTDKMSYTSDKMSQTTDKMSDNIKDIKDIKVDNKDLVPKPKKIAKPKKEVDPLYHPIKESFLSKNDNMFTDWKKEGAGIKGLIKKARQRNSENPEVFIQSMIEKFYTMTNNGDKFWKGQPFLPSSLNGSSIFDRVLKKIQDLEPSQSDSGDFNVIEGLF
ncbi:hypothetical protein KAR91_69760 [Candidatus Pacearchaeota archaeon]|nr:hypothetical protein [Candidatus Pacearchaeota archaeon]